MASDYEREIHGGSDDRPGVGECLAQTRETIAALEAGDMDCVPPWMTVEEALAQARAEEASYMRHTCLGGTTHGKICLACGETDDDDGVGWSPDMYVPNA